MERIDGGTGGDVDGDRVIARNASAFAADQRAAVDAARVIDDANVIDAIAQGRFGGVGAGADMEHGAGDAGIRRDFCPPSGRFGSSE